MTLSRYSFDGFLCKIRVDRRELRGRCRSMPHYRLCAGSLDEKSCARAASTTRPDSICLMLEKLRCEYTHSVRAWPIETDYARLVIKGGFVAPEGSHAPLLKTSKREVYGGAQLLPSVRAVWNRPNEHNFIFRIH